MPLNNFDARKVTMHYKRKGDRVDDVLHNIVLDHVNNLEQENKRLREALEKIATRKMSCYLSESAMNQDFIKIARQALEGDKND